MTPLTRFWTVAKECVDCFEMGFDHVGCTRRVLQQEQISTAPSHSTEEVMFSATISFFPLHSSFLPLQPRGPALFLALTLLQVASDDAEPACLPASLPVCSALLFLLSFFLSAHRGPLEPNETRPEFFPARECACARLSRVSLPLYNHFRDWIKPRILEKKQG